MALRPRRCARPNIPGCQCLFLVVLLGFLLHPHVLTQTITVFHSRLKSKLFTTTSTLVIGYSIGGGDKYDFPYSYSFTLLRSNKYMTDLVFQVQLLVFVSLQFLLQSGQFVLDLPQ